jgi:hypothetical protein
MIDCHYGHLAREHAIKLLDSYTGADSASVHPVDAAWTPQPLVAHHEREATRKQEETESPLTDSNPTPLYEEGPRVKLVGGCIVQLGRCWWGWWVVSGAHLSIASY